MCTVDIDPQLVSQARHRLARLGYTPMVVTADGADGLAEHAPFDRIIATCAVVPRGSRHNVSYVPISLMYSDDEAASTRPVIRLKLTQVGSDGRVELKFDPFAYRLRVRHT